MESHADGEQMFYLLPICYFRNHLIINKHCRRSRWSRRDENFFQLLTNGTHPALKHRISCIVTPHILHSNGCKTTLQSHTSYSAVSQPLQHNLAAVAVQSRNRCSTISQQLQYNLAAVAPQIICRYFLSTEWYRRPSRVTPAALMRRRVSLLLL